jgi:hypothetical protein
VPGCFAGMMSGRAFFLLKGGPRPARMSAIG